VFDQLRGEFPNLSLGNVYRNLNILVEQGLANRLGFGSTFDVYEAKRDGHVHFVCQSCGAIEDVAVTPEQHQAIHEWFSSESGREVETMELHGLCASCRAERSPETDAAV
jgi:Fur family peroxide stress response transcriptional regulator